MIKIFNSLCESCCNDECKSKNICSKCKKLDTCYTFKWYADEYYSIIGKDDDEKLQIEELKEIFIHDNDAVDCQDFDCTDYEMSDEQRKSDQEDEEYDRRKYLKYFR